MRCAAIHRAPRLRLLAAAALSLTLPGCINFHQSRLGAGEAPTLIGPAVRDNRTPMDPALGCFAPIVAAASPRPLVIAVGDVRDYTGKISVNEGTAITQGGALMVYSALGKLGSAVRPAERFDPSIAERELAYTDHRQLGDGRAHDVAGSPAGAKVPWLPYYGGSIVASDYFIVGGITELNYDIHSGGIDTEVSQLGPKARTFTQSVAIDLRIVDTHTLLVARTISLTKQFTGYEVGFNIFRFFGSNLFDIDAGAKGQEPVQLGIRTALDSSENMAANAAVVLQNAQNAGTGIVNTLQLGSAAKIGVAGDITASGLTLNDNQALGSATGNDATNAATAKAANRQASIAVNSLQDSDGGVSVAIGSPTDRADAMITGGAVVEDSSLSVSGNSLGGTATGQTVSNSLGLAAGAATGTQPGVPAASGTIGTSYGATGDLALANNQKLGEPSTDGSLTPAVTSTVVGDFGVAATGPVSRSSLTVDGNSQQALALGNGAINRLSASTTSPVAGDAPVTVASASSQYGQARVAATSQAWSVGNGRLDASSTSLSGNNNLAQATINDADNALTINVAGSASGPRGLATLSSDQLGPPVASGGAIVTNQQFAAGSVAAAASSLLGDDARDRDLAESEFTVADNVTSADATANHAINAASATGSGGAAGLGLVNAQINTASARADAAADAHYVAAPMAGAVVDSSDLALNDNHVSSVARGNAASNTVTASGSDNVLPATAQAGRFDATAQGAAALVNSQANYAGITADAGATSLAVPLNAAGTIVGSTIAVSGSKVSASGYGNVAINSVTASPLGGSPGAAIANAQSNFGSVTALVTGAHAGIASGPVANALLSITGNALSATAVGNQANNTITTGH